MTASNGLRIALMPSAYAPAVGGVEVLTARLAHNLQARGHAVQVWAPAGEGLPDHESIDGIEVRRFRFPMPRAQVSTAASFPFVAVRALRELHCALTDFKPTHIHVQCFSGNGAYATALSRLTGIPLVVTLQGETVMDDHDIYNHSATLRVALRWGLRRAAQVTGCSQFTLDDAHARFALDRMKASVIFNGVDLDEIAPSPTSIPYKRYILAMGRVVHKKGFDLLIDAYATLHELLPDVGLVIGGTGAQLPALQRQVNSLELGASVHFTGRLDRSQVAAVMAGADVFVMPSRLEPFGIVVLEAWRAGVPVIATRHGGPPEFVGPQKRGLVVAPEDTAALANALSELLDNSALRHSIIAQATAALPKFTWAEVARQYEAIYA